MSSDVKHVNLTLVTRFDIFQILWSACAAMTSLHGNKAQQLLSQLQQMMSQEVIMNKKDAYLMSSLGDDDIIASVWGDTDIYALKMERDHRDGRPEDVLKR